MSEPRASVILELHSADRLVRTLMLEEMARLGLQPSLFAILSLIGLHQPVTPSDLATLRRLTRSRPSARSSSRVRSTTAARDRLGRGTGEGCHPGGAPSA